MISALQRCIERPRAFEVEVVQKPGVITPIRARPPGGAGPPVAGGRRAAAAHMPSASPEPPASQRNSAHAQERPARAYMWLDGAGGFMGGDTPYWFAKQPQEAAERMFRWYLETHSDEVASEHAALREEMLTRAIFSQPGDEPRRLFGMANNMRIKINALLREYARLLGVQERALFDAQQSVGELWASRDPSERGEWGVGDEEAALRIPEYKWFRRDGPFWEELTRERADGPIHSRVPADEAFRYVANYIVKTMRADPALFVYRLRVRVIEAYQQPVAERAAKEFVVRYEHMPLKTTHVFKAGVILNLRARHVPRTERAPPRGPPRPNQTREHKRELREAEREEVYEE